MATPHIAGKLLLYSARNTPTWTSAQIKAFDYEYKQGMTCFLLIRRVVPIYGVGRVWRWDVEDIAVASN